MVIRTRMPIPDGWRGARCRNLVTTYHNDPVYDKEQQADMVEFCNHPDPCAIRHSCLLFALINNCTEGVWGGMSPEDRRAMRKKYPLELGLRNEQGSLIYRARPEWRWLRPGCSVALLTAAEKNELDEEDIYGEDY